MNIRVATKANNAINAAKMGTTQQYREKRMVYKKIGANSPLRKRTVKKGQFRPYFGTMMGRTDQRGKFAH
jgi:hypothetical protein